MTIENGLSVSPVDITESDDVLSLLHVLQVSVTHTADTNTGNVQFIRRSNVSVCLTQHYIGDNCQRSSCCCSSLKE